MLLEVPAAGIAAEMELGERAAELEGLVERIERTAGDGDVSGNLAADVSSISPSSTYAAIRGSPNRLRGS
jgi:hypothetical protein